MYLRTQQLCLAVQSLCTKFPDIVKTLSFSNRMHCLPHKGFIYGILPTNKKSIFFVRETDFELPDNAYHQYCT